MSFRPLIRGFFFYSWLKRTTVSLSLPFPSPHSGILFLYEWREYTSEITDEMFPSPHSGILFLFLCRP